MFCALHDVVNEFAGGTFLEEAGVYAFEKF